MTLPTFYIRNDDVGSGAKLYLQNNAGDGLAPNVESVVTTVRRTKQANADIMTMPYADEGDTLVMRGMSGTEGKIQVSGTATAQTISDAKEFIQALKQQCSAALASVSYYFDGIENYSGSEQQVAVTDISYTINAGEVYIIKWTIGMVRGSII